MFLFLRPFICIHTCIYNIPFTCLSTSLNHRCCCFLVCFFLSFQALKIYADRPIFCFEMYTYTHTQSISLVSQPNFVHCKVQCGCAILYPADDIEPLVGAVGMEVIYLDKVPSRLLLCMEKSEHSKTIQVELDRNGMQGRASRFDATRAFMLQLRCYWLFFLSSSFSVYDNTFCVGANAELSDLMSVVPSGPPALPAPMLSSPQDSKTTCSSKSATVFTLPA